MLGTVLGLELMPEERERRGSHGYVKQEARNTSCLLGAPPLGPNSLGWRKADKVMSEIIPQGPTGVALPTPFSASF